MSNPSNSGDRPPAPASSSTRQVLGVDFFIGSLEEAVAQSMQGGLVLAPSGPGLAVDLVKSPSYREAVNAADLVLTDSGALVLLWWLFAGERIPRHSGLKFLRAVLEQPELKKPGAVFWVMPSKEESARNFSWLAAQGFAISEEDLYVAPHYQAGSISDDELLNRLKRRRPRIVMVTIGGGVQERLGHFLRERLSDRPAILCLGAAIAFITGGQAEISPWADRFMLGWLFRIFYSPRRYAKRYWEALALIWLTWRYREKMPPLRG